MEGVEGDLSGRASLDNTLGEWHCAFRGGNSFCWIDMMKLEKLSVESNF